MWRKSSYSQGASNCVEVTSWRKPSASNPSGSCVEAGNGPGLVAVRDTKNRDGGMITVTPAAWRDFTARYSQQ